MEDRPTYERAPGWVWRNLLGAVLAMGPDQQGHRLEAEAALVWRALEVPADGEGLAAALEPVAAPAGRDAEDLVGEALERLVGLGAVRHVPTGVDGSAS